jgi:hypothetical protein
VSDKINRAQKAERILTDPEFVAAFANTRQAIFDQMERTPLRDDEGLKYLRICLKLLSDVKANLTAVLNDGKLEEFRIEQAKKDVPRLSDFRR